MNAECDVDRVTLQLLHTIGTNDDKGKGRLRGCSANDACHGIGRTSIERRSIVTTICA